jgi:hypothetical protein
MAACSETACKFLQMPTRDRDTPSRKKKHPFKRFEEILENDRSGRDLLRFPHDLALAAISDSRPKPQEISR